MSENTPTVTSSFLGLSPAEVERFSFVKCIRCLAEPGSRAREQAASFERRISSDASRMMGQASGGFVVPLDVLHGSPRTMNAITGGAGTYGQRTVLNATTNGEGGYLVADELRPQSFIELLRNSAFMMRMCTLLTGLVGDVKIPKQATGSTGYWVAEGIAPSASSPTLAQISLTPKTVGTHVDYTRQLLLQGTPSIEQFVRNDLAQTIGLAIDLAAIAGTGANSQPHGLIGSADVGSVTGSSAITWGDVVELETDVLSQNAGQGRLAYLLNPTVKGALKSTPKDTNSASFLMEPDGSINGYPAFITAQCPARHIIFGAWQELIIGMWGGIELLTDPYSLSTTGSVRIVAMASCDIALRHGQAFSVCADATA